MALIEVLVSILIFSFGVLGLIGLEASAVHFSVDAEDRNRAALFANDIASTMWLQGAVSYTPTQLATWQSNVADTSLPTGLPNGQVSVTAVAGTTNSTDISITWQPQTDQTLTTRTLSTRVTLP
jgi:type IV pilus assembly protein PilV